MNTVISSPDFISLFLPSQLQFIFRDDKHWQCFADKQGSRTRVMSRLLLDLTWEIVCSSGNIFQDHSTREYLPISLLTWSWIWIVWQIWMICRSMIVDVTELVHEENHGSSRSLSHAVIFGSNQVLTRIRSIGWLSVERSVYNDGIRCWWLSGS